jgi:hypothetical protein
MAAQAPYVPGGITPYLITLPLDKRTAPVDR